jgi:hypothetical protein
VSDRRAEIARLEAYGEEAYDAMYDARRPKDCWEDASAAFRQAIRLAREEGLEDQADRLQARLDHIHAVYDHQFR